MKKSMMFFYKLAWYCVFQILAVTISISHGELCISVFWIQSCMFRVLLLEQENDILQTTHWNAFSWQKISVCRLKFGWILFNWKWMIMGVVDDLAPNRWQFITETNDDLFHLQMCHQTSMCSILKVETHGDVIKWKHFLHNWPFVRGIHRWLMSSPHKDRWRGALMYALICAWTNGQSAPPGRVKM